MGGGLIPKPDDLRDLLFALEQQLLDPGVRCGRARLGELLAEDFREFGSSGRAFDREAILDLLAAEAVDDIAIPVATISDFEISLLAPDVALATYTAVSPAGASRRSSLWVCRNGKWLLVFHQGTPVRVWRSEGMRR